MVCLLVAAAVGLALVSSVSCQGTVCTVDNTTRPCICTFSGSKTDMDGKKINLLSLAPTAGQPFMIPKASDGNAYSYNPCYTFTDGNCKAVAGCQTDGGAKRSIGVLSTATLTVEDNGQVLFSYSGGRQGRKFMVHLICGHGNQFQFLNETTSNTYAFSLTSPCACPGGCTDSGPTAGSKKGGGGDGAGVVGIVLIALLILAIVVYIVAGIIINKVKFQKSGTDVIPNKTFWVDFPFLVKDGFVFSFTPCMWCYNKGRGYDKV